MWRTFKHLVKRLFGVKSGCDVCAHRVERLMTMGGKVSYCGLFNGAKRFEPIGICKQYDPVDKPSGK